MKSEDLKMIERVKSAKSKTLPKWQLDGLRHYASTGAVTTKFLKRVYPSQTSINEANHKVASFNKEKFQAASYSNKL